MPSTCTTNAYLFIRLDFVYIYIYIYIIYRYSVAHKDLPLKELERIEIS
jgi:hypothetical protein